MPTIMKSLIWCTVEKYCEQGYKKSQAIVLAANELGLSVSEVSQGIYYTEMPVIETRGYKVDPEWYDRVVEIATHIDDFKVRLRYLERLVKALGNPKLPIDHRRLESLVLLLRTLGQEADECRPRLICADCAKKHDPQCVACGGYGWLSK